ncbi:MAG: iron-containing alcohol dehydrogenase [Clostridia bacterium]|nr:iron-containing alcohol dehydrogenase [Clostridia bacterium]
MTNFDFFMPVKTYFGENALTKAENELVCGKHALIVTGKHSAKLCGALDDVTAILDEHGIDHTLFDKIGENPKLSVCFEGGALARELGADFIIGIGGGSPLDAAKAIAAFGADKNLTESDIFTTDIANMLPIILIPTTSGTGSEVNNYSVLTIDEKNVKKTFKSTHSYAKAAILDPKYTYTLGVDYTLSTALDAFCHCIESYLSPKSTDISMMFALYGAKKLWNAFKAIKNDPDALANSEDTAVKALRADLMAAACAGGIAINTTGTGFPHPLGYSITLYNGIPHGKACAVFTGEYIKYNMKNETGSSKLYAFASHLDTTPEEIACTIPDLAGVYLKLDADARREYVDQVRGASNYANSPYVISYEEMLDIYNRAFI